MPAILTGIDTNDFYSKQRTVSQLYSKSVKNKSQKINLLYILKTTVYDKTFFYAHKKINC
jgi:hypothetical protein